MDILVKILSALCLIGALNWGLIGFFGLDLVALLFGPMTFVSRLIYALVGLSAVGLIVLSFRNLKQ
ncbi:MAG: DUF378 domain-containing protein [Alphaproteobacteria bacterium]|nr:DUF378 domain-containing protein [Alphaproteobacteria bacterium]